MIAMNKWRRIKMQLITIKQQQSSYVVGRDVITPVYTSYYVLDKEYSTPEIMNFLFGLTDDDFDKDEEAYWMFTDDEVETLVWIEETKEIIEQYIKVR